MFCTKCGARLPDDALFCPHCGKTTILNTNAAPVQQPVFPVQQVAPVQPMQQAQPFAPVYAAINQNNIPVTKRKFWKYVNIPFGILGTLFLAFFTFNFAAPLLGIYSSNHFAEHWYISTPFRFASFNESCSSLIDYPDIVHTLKMNCIFPAAMYFIALSLLVLAFALIKNPIAKLCTMTGAVVLGIITLAIVA